MSWKMNDDDKIIREYYGDDGWTYVMRTPDGIEYHISRNQIIENNYKNIYME